MMAMEIDLQQEINEPENILAEVAKLETSPSFLTLQSLNSLEDIISQHGFVCSHKRLIHITAFSSCICGRSLHVCREIENFLSLR